MISLNVLPTAPALQTSSIRGGDGFITSQQWPSHFRGLVYIESLNKAFCPDGLTVTRRTFTIRYGGYRFAMDAQGVKQTTDPWVAWTQHRVYAPTIVTDICSDSKLRHGAIVTSRGQKLLNIAAPYEAVAR